MWFCVAGTDIEDVETHFPPAILVPSVLLTATLMCVTSLRPPSSLPHLPTLAALPPTHLKWWRADGCDVDASDTWRIAVGWPSVMSTVRLGVIPNHLPFGSEWIKNSPCCGEKAELPPIATKGRRRAPMSHLLAPVGQRRANPDRI